MKLTLSSKIENDYLIVEASGSIDGRSWRHVGKVMDTATDDQRGNSKISVMERKR